MSIFGVLLIMFITLNSAHTENHNISSQNEEYDTLKTFTKYHNFTSTDYQFTNRENLTTPQNTNVLQRPAFNTVNITANPQGNRQSRNTKMVNPTGNLLGNAQYSTSPEFRYASEQYKNPVPFPPRNEIKDLSTSLESPLLYSQRRQGYEDDTENYGHYYQYLPETTTEAYEVEEDETETPTPDVETTTLAPFTLADVKVPAPFLRIEYMISFTFLGIMYGLGFFVLFQSLCVPAAKIAVYIVYITLLKLGAVDPVTLEQALEQLPPT